MLSWSWVEERLRVAHNYWAATAGPHASPIWALWREHVRVRLRRYLPEGTRSRTHPASSSISSGAEVVIVEGEADQIAPTQDPRRVREKYGPVEAEIGNWYRVRPQRVLAWREDDYPQARRASTTIGTCQHKGNPWEWARCGRAPGRSMGAETSNRRC
jgi:hypothetical protein